MVQAYKKAEKLKKARALEEFDAFMAKCNDIEDAEGKKARDAYETQYQLDQIEKEAQKKRDVENLKRELLDAGQDPHTELDAERAVFLLEHDVDLVEVAGTPQNERRNKEFLKRAKKKRGKGGADTEVHNEKQRYIVACQVADLKARGIDPMKHFSQEDVREKTRAMYKMDDRVADKVAKQYQALMAENGGRLTPAQEGEVPFVYNPEADVVEEVAEAATKPSTKAERDEVRKKRKEERAAAKAEAKKAKQAAKEEAAAKKVAAAAAALAAKEAAAAAASTVAAGAGMIDDGEIAATANGDMAAAAGNNAVAESSIEKPAEEAPVAVTATTTTSASKASDKATEIIAQLKAAATPRNAATVLIGGGAAVYGINYYKENNGAAQADRERQLKLILGEDEDDDEDDDDEFDDDEDDEFEQFTKKKSPQPPTKSEDTTTSKPAPPAEEPKKVTPPPPPAAKPKPKRLGIFAKRNADARETDINALFQPSAQAPEFAALLAKILTFGAPGRFPEVAAWGSMPFDEFELEKAKSLLVESRTGAGLTDEQSAEIFASVVNCMIIDIVDLASATLKGKDKDQKLTVDAINVVMDFMDHAASLFDAVAEDVTIKPVTYGGKLRKKDLEQMFSVYAGSAMMSLDALAGGGTSQDRVDTLQLVFAITDKKAEGLMQKHMMKMMMDLMKDGGKGLEGMEGMPGMEGMEEMMKAMGGAGGMPGMPGMPGMDGEMSPEDLKQTVGMMKDLMDSGQVSEEELAEVRSQFKEMYGSDISDLIKKASDEGAEGGMTDDERALLDMFKQILGED